ncbi:hypothetical protein [Caenibacillus caldisaponilyticus]|uniref:hypothetical protein n=1 Tax=Caenibacillus caldisaponilyticus TaxID=1674942 RepID=UPI0009888837|nr:hypothetical protein [Caenibacillus caldisaponilyticus]
MFNPDERGSKMADDGKRKDFRDGNDNNGQSRIKVHGGESRNGRLSALKNHNVHGEGLPNEYVAKPKDDDAT